SLLELFYTWKIPNLKCLNVRPNEKDMEKINQFIKLNPQIEELKLNIKTLSEYNELYHFFNEVLPMMFNLTKFEYIKSNTNFCPDLLTFNSNKLNEIFYWGGLNNNIMKSITNNLNQLSR